MSLEQRSTVLLLDAMNPSSMGVVINPQEKRPLGQGEKTLMFMTWMTKYTLTINCDINIKSHNWYLFPITAFNWVW